MKARWVLAGVGVFVALSVPVQASEKSQRLDARGLVEFHAERYREAMVLFDQAVSEDSDDVTARYHRAITRARLGDDATAIADLRAILRAQPDLGPAAIELGILLIQRDQFQEAVPWLETAQRDPSVAARASIFLGVAQLRLGQPGQALNQFDRATADPEWRLTAEYYQGVADYQEGRWLAARKHFEFVIRNQPESELAGEARDFLTRLGRGDLSRYHLYGSVSFLYDSNVSIAPSSSDLSDAQLGISQRGDAATALSAGFGLIPWRNEWAQFSLGYDFFQSLYVELTEFNLQNHRGGLQFFADLGPVQVGQSGRYDYYLLQTQSFLQEGSSLTWITIPEGGSFQTEVWFRFRRRDFKQAAYYIRDTINYSPGIRQVWYLGTTDRYLSVGYRFDTDDPVHHTPAPTVADPPENPNQFAYDGHEASANFGWVLPWSVASDLGFAYRNEDYAKASEGTTLPPMSRRVDNAYLFSAALRKRLDEHFDIVLAFQGNVHNSNQQDLYQYDRYIGSITLEARL